MSDIAKEIFDETMSGKPPSDFVTAEARESAQNAMQAKLDAINDDSLRKYAVELVQMRMRYVFALADKQIIRDLATSLETP